MSENTVVAIAWIVVAAVILGLAGCTFGISSASSRAESEMASKCWEIGGSWETGWNGKWCNRNPA